MKKNKAILKHCPNFYKIINFEFSEDDSITLKLIEVYKNYVFNIDINNTDDVKSVEKFDFVVNKYLEDYFFRKDMQSRLLNIRIKKSASNVLEQLVESIIDAFDSYETGYTRNIYFARWI